MTVFAVDTKLWCLLGIDGQVGGREGGRSNASTVRALLRNLDNICNST